MARFHRPVTIPVKYLVITTGDTVDSGTSSATSQPKKGFRERSQVYAEIDLEMKARALEKCSTTDFKKPTTTSDGTLMAFLRAI